MLFVVKKIVCKYSVFNENLNLTFVYNCYFYRQNFYLFNFKNYNYE